MTHIGPIPAAATWPLRHKVMWPHKPKEYVILPEDAQGLHVGLWVNDQLVSVVSAFVHEREAQFRKFATAIPWQGKGYGSQLLTYLIDHLSQQNIEKIWCNARVEKAVFYQKFGFQLTERTFTKDQQAYVVMERIRDQA